MRRLIISVIALLGAAAAHAATGAPELADNPPDRHIVVPGDTLWGISGRFLKQPWRWPEIWRMNRDEIRNPHLIYPGDVIVLDRSDGTPRLRLDGASTASTASGRPVVTLSPTVRAEPIAGGEIPSIPASAIEPFLSKPLIVDTGALDRAPRVIATEESRLVLGTGDTAYVSSLPEQQGRDWQVFRPGRAFVDPVTREPLGHEAVYLGDARAMAFGTPSTVEIVRAGQEIHIGDRFVPAPPATFVSYVPHAPEQPVEGRILSAYGAVSEVAQNSIVTINRGRRDGIELGHVLSVWRNQNETRDRLRRGSKYTSDLHDDGRGVDDAKRIKLPDERYGTLFVFRTFDRVSYALVVETTRPVNVLDYVRNP